MITIHGKGATAKDLKNTVLETPENAGGYWKGTQHAVLINTLVRQMRYRGYKVSNPQFALSGKGADLAAGFDLRIPGLHFPRGITPSIGILTSNAMKRSLTIVTGGRVVCCNNGICTGQIILQKKHTTNFNLRKSISKALDEYELQSTGMTSLVAGLRRTGLRNAVASDILIQAGRMGLMNWTRIGKVDQEYHNPSFEEHGKGTSWALLNAFTYIAKQAPVPGQMDSMNAFRELLPVKAAV